MVATYLQDFQKWVERGVAYIPLGTLEWHGDHLPLETDFLIAQKVCELLAEDFPGYILPPFYLGTYGSAIINGKLMRGMDRKLKKILPGNVYFLKPELFKEVIVSLVANLKDQGFKKIILITGHGGSNQMAVLESVAADDVLVINPYKLIDKIRHADEGETSVFWACYPEEETRAKAIKTTDKDLTNYYGEYPFLKASKKLGEKYLAVILEESKARVKEFL